MNTPTDIQIIEQHGRPAFAVIPWHEFEAIAPALKRHRALRDGIPNVVAKRIMLDDIHPVCAWREHLGLAQSVVAAQAGMKQPALARIEKGNSKPQTATYQRLADAMGLSVAQLQLD